MPSSDLSGRITRVAVPLALSWLVGALLLLIPRVRAEGRGVPAQQIACAGGATTISPCGTSVDTLMPSATGMRPFVVQNASATDHTYMPSCAVTPPLTSCTMTPNVLVVPAGGSGSIAVTYSASSATAAAQGTVTVVVDGGASDLVATIVAVGTVPSAATPQ